MERRERVLSRNKYLRRYLMFSMLVLLAGGILIWVWAPRSQEAAVAIFAVLMVLMMLASLAVHIARYAEIAKLSGYLRKITNGARMLDVRDNDEGELSILKSEIYKLTVRLEEQAELLKKDKIFLADSISDISHQLKTPLTSMRVMNDLLCEEALPLEKRREFNNNIASQLERMQWLLSSLLKLAKLDAGTVEFKKDDVTAEELIRRATQPLLIPMELKGQTILREGNMMQELYCDKNWMTEALVNIVKNAVEHTGEGGMLRFIVSDNPIYTELAVEDNGGGIPKDDLPYVFIRFHRGKNAGEDSVGIGLAMAKSIVEQHGGSILVESWEGKGTRFAIRLYKHAV